LLFFGAVLFFNLSNSTCCLCIGNLFCADE